jgi:hypothetical protein
VVIHKCTSTNSSKMQPRSGDSSGLIVLLLDIHSPSSHSLLYRVYCLLLITRSPPSSHSLLYRVIVYSSLQDHHLPRPLCPTPAHSSLSGDAANFYSAHPCQLSTRLSTHPCLPLPLMHACLGVQGAIPGCTLTGCTTPPGQSLCRSVCTGR